MSKHDRASISGFTFIRNGVKLGFPFEASIRSLWTTARLVHRQCSISRESTQRSLGIGSPMKPNQNLHRTRATC